VPDLSHNPAIGIAAVVFCGVASQWIAARLRIPSIVVLLTVGVLVGPVSGLIEPDDLFGDLLFPLVSLGVAILLFEGGLNLRVDRLAGARSTVIRLVTVGVATTAVVAFVALKLILPIDNGQAALIAAIVTVSGPTVVMPLLRLARPREPAGAILRWEGIFIDPVGVVLAVVVLDAVIEDQTIVEMLVRIGVTAVAGTVVGAAASILLLWVLHRHWVPDHLHNGVVLMAVLSAFAIADLLRHEAGLFATTILGVAMANQRDVDVEHIHEFEENLGQLVLGGLFIVLAARVDLGAVWDNLDRTLLFVAVLILIGRPLCVLASTLGSDVPWSTRRFLMWMAPRGIVAASAASLFELQLIEAGRDPAFLVPVVFSTIIATVTIYGFTAAPMARWLRVARTAPIGVAFLGAPDWARQLAARLADHEVPVLMITNRPFEARAATREGLLVFNGRLDSEDLAIALETVGISEAVALSRTEELNAFGVARFIGELGRAQVWHLPPADDGAEQRHSLGRRPFGRGVSQASIEERVRSGGFVDVIAAGDVDHDLLTELVPLGFLTPRDGAGRYRFSVAAASRMPRENELLVAVRAAPEPATSAEH